MELTPELIIILILKTHTAKWLKEGTYLTFAQAEAALRSLENENEEQITDKDLELAVLRAVVKDSPVESNQTQALQTTHTLSGDELWTAMLARLSPPAIQALVRQHCRLISSDNESAVILVRTAPLLKLVEQKRTNIERAFKGALGKDIRLVFQAPVTS